MYSWPGNVRELQRLVERTVALTTGSRIEVDDLPPQIRGDYTDVFGPPIDAGASMRAYGSRYAGIVYERCERNKRKACKTLGISYHTLDAYLHYAQGQQSRRKTMPAWVARRGREDEEAGTEHA